MPIYEYICPECNTKFEQLRPLSQSDQPAECPKCKKPARRQLSTFAAFSASLGGVPKTIPGAGGGNSCSSCSSGDCSTCAF
jgi:putative FmdB family regulatory protein